MRLTRSDLASDGLFPPEVSLACLTVLARDARMHDTLAANPVLPDVLWRQLWGTRPPAARAKLLVSRTLSSELRQIVLERESRVGVLAEFVQYNALTPTEQAQLVARSHGAPVDVLLAQNCLAADLRKEAALKASPSSLLQEVAYDPYGLFDDVEAIALTGYADELLGSVPARARSRYLRALLFHRPSVIEHVLQSGNVDSFMTAAAGSLTLSADAAWTIAKAPLGQTPDEFEQGKFALMALLANPVVGLDVVQHVRDAVAACPWNGSYAAQQICSVADGRLSRGEHMKFVPGEPLDLPALQWLLRRGLPSDYGAGRELELLVAVTNESSTDAIRTRAAGALLAIAEPALLERHRSALEDSGLTWQSAVQGVLRAPVPATSTATWAMLARELGPSLSRWETFLGLLEEFDGSLEDLVAVSSAL